jgi:hypothetical protein
MEASDTDKCALASMITEKGCYLSMSLIDAYHSQLFDFWMNSKSLSFNNFIFIIIAMNDNILISSCDH